jgi:branched-chain amino acid transport system substrate-binding protein
VQELAKLDPAQLDNLYIGAVYYTPQMTTIPAKPQADLATFEKYYDITKHDLGQGQQGWETALFVATLLQQVPGTVTAATVKEAAKTAKGDLPFRTVTYDCSKPTWPGTTACATGFLYGKATPDRKIELLPNQPTDISSVLPAG